MDKVLFGPTFTVDQTDKEYSGTQACKYRPGRVGGGGGGEQMRIFQGKEEGNRSVFDHTFSWIM